MAKKFYTIGPWSKLKNVSHNHKISQFHFLNCLSKTSSRFTNLILLIYSKVFTNAFHPMIFFLSLQHTRTHLHTHTHTHALSHSHFHTHMFYLSYSLLHTRTHTHSLNFMHTQTHNQALSLSYCLSLSHTRS